MSNFNHDTIDKLAQDVVQLLQARTMKVAFAESCTGGMVAAAITSVAGASDVLDISIVTYANWAKIQYTDVTAEILEQFGAVSSQTAEMMASCMERMSGGIGVGITGIAGPEGGTPDKPVGTIYIAVDAHSKHACEHCVFEGDRAAVRLQTTQKTLELLLEVVHDDSL